MQEGEGAGREAVTANGQDIDLGKIIAVLMAG